MVGWMSSLGAALPPLSESIMKIHMNAPVHGKLEHFSCECVWNIGVYIYTSVSWHFWIWNGTCYRISINRKHCYIKSPFSWLNPVYFMIIPSSIGSAAPACSWFKARKSRPTMGQGCQGGLKQSFLGELSTKQCGFYKKNMVNHRKSGVTTNIGI